MSNEEKMRMLAGTMSYRNIALELGLSYHQVYSYMKKHGLAGKAGHGIARKQFAPKLNLLEDVGSGIYYINNVTRNITYFGYSDDVHCRMNGHLTKLQNGTHKNRQMQKHWGANDEFDIGVAIQGHCPHLEQIIISLNPSVYNVNKEYLSYEGAREHTERFKRNICHTDSCWIWTGSPDKDGYGTFTWREDGAVKKALVHRLQYYLTYGPIPSGMIVRHKCHHKMCVNPDHLELGTNKQNANDGHANHGRPKKFADWELELLIKRGLTNSEIARKLGVSPSTITHRRKKCMI